MPEIAHSEHFRDGSESYRLGPLKYPFLPIFREETGGRVRVWACPRDDSLRKSYLHLFPTPVQASQCLAASRPRKHSEIVLSDFACCLHKPRPRFVRVPSSESI